MLKNRNLRIILSLIAAILMWIYVVGSVNPASTRQIRNIPITLNHTDVLGERGLAVSGMNVEDIDIEISGPRASVNDIDVSDITATVDLATATKGENELTIMIRVPIGSGIEITDRSTSKITVVVEDMVQKTVDVTVVYSGTFADGQEGTTLGSSLDQVTVSGAESIVNLVQSARGTIDASRLSSGSTELICQLQAVNGDGNPVDGVTLSQDTVTVEAILSETKSVKLNVEVNDNSSDELVRNTEVPDEIFITGKPEDISGITSIDALPVDVTNMGEDAEIPLEFELPDGVRISDKYDQPVLFLTISPLESKTLSYDASDIVIEGAQANIKYKVKEDQKFTVTIMDSSQVLGGINKSDIELVANVSEISGDSGTVELEIKYDGKLHSLEASPGEAEVETE